METGCPGPSRSGPERLGASNLPIITPLYPELWQNMRGPPLLPITLPTCSPSPRDPGRSSHHGSWGLRFALALQTEFRCLCLNMESQPTAGSYYRGKGRRLLGTLAVEGLARLHWKKEEVAMELSLSQPVRAAK